LAGEAQCHGLVRKSKCDRVELAIAKLQCPLQFLQLRFEQRKNKAIEEYIEKECSSVLLLNVM
jgi:hypothetical protein